MEKEQCIKLLDAVESVGIKNYQFDSDMSDHLYNNDSSFIKYSEDDNMVYNVRNGNFGGSHNSTEAPLQIICAAPQDLHTFRISGDYDHIKTFLETLGLTLSDSDKKIMMNIDKLNYDIIPETGDYHRFVILTKKQYDALTPEEQEAYDIAKAEYDKQKAEYIEKNMAASLIDTMW